MDRKTEIELLEELAGLREARSFYLDDAATVSPVALHLPGAVRAGAADAVPVQAGHRRPWQRTGGT